MSKSGKQARRLAVQSEIRKREEALGVPTDRQVFVFKQHYPDAGGPRPLTVKKFQDRPEDFDFERWRDRLRNATEQWEPLEIAPDRDPDLPSDLPLSDYSEVNGLMILSARAATALRPLMQPCGVWLPLVCDDAEYVGFRLDSEIDVLDVDKTRASWWPKKQAASSIYTYAFHTERLGSAAIFRVPQHFEILVNHEFVGTVRANELSGFRFCRVWPTAMATLWWYENWC